MRRQWGEAFVVIAAFKALSFFLPLVRSETTDPINTNLWWRKLPCKKVILRNDTVLIASTVPRLSFRGCQLASS